MCKSLGARGRSALYMVLYLVHAMMHMLVPSKLPPAAANVARGTLSLLGKWVSVMPVRPTEWRRLHTMQLRCSTYR